jgi:hypothetical protein
MIYSQSSFGDRGPGAKPRSSISGLVFLMVTSRPGPRMCRRSLVCMVLAATLWRHPCRVMPKPGGDSVAKLSRHPFQTNFASQRRTGFSVAQNPDSQAVGAVVVQNPDIAGNSRITCGHRRQSFRYPVASGWSLTRESGAEKSAPYLCPWSFQAPSPISFRMLQTSK